MAFIRSKKIKGRTYYYLVSCFRTKQGKVRQKVVAYLGTEPSIKGKIDYLTWWINWQTERMAGPPPSSRCLRPLSQSEKAAWDREWIEEKANLERQIKKRKK